jgi:hypothetical protein
MVSDDYVKLVKGSGVSEIECNKNKNKNTQTYSSEDILEESEIHNEHEDNSSLNEEEIEQQTPEILSVKCLDTDGKETAICSANKLLTLEATCNASVREGATVTFNVYPEGATPEQDEPVETLTASVRQNRAQVTVNAETVGTIAGTILGLAGGAPGVLIGRAVGRRVARLFVRANSAGCEEVQSEVVEVEPARSHPFRSITDGEVATLKSHPRFSYEWDLPNGYVARRGSILSFQSVRSRTPRITANILGTNRTIAYWIFVEEPGQDGRVIGVPVLYNMANNGGLDTGRWANIRTALGGTATGRFSSFTLSATGNAVTIRTVLRNTIQAVFEDLASEVPNFAIIFGGSVADRTGDTRSKNHPNGVAIDINFRYNQNVLRTDPARNQVGINATRPRLISAEVESIINRHGWRAGYFFSPRLNDGLFHWSVSGT